MSRLSKAAKKLTSSPVKSVTTALNPIYSAGSSAIQKATGLSELQQLGIGAAVGGGAMLMAPGAAAGGATAAAGGAAGASSAGSGVLRALSGGIAPALIGGGIGLIGGKQQADAQRDVNDANIALAREQMDWSAGQADREMAFQERMSSTAYQRVTDDMRKAGLNPMLAIDNGGASSPSGAMGSASLPDVAPVPSVVMNSLNSAISSLKSFSDARYSMAMADKAHQDIIESGSSINLKDSEARLNNSKASELGLEKKIFDLLNKVFDAGSSAAKEIYQKYNGPELNFDGPMREYDRR